MDDNQNLEVFFCDLCNTSVPARDLEIQQARRIKDKVIGACCLKALAPQAVSRGAGAPWLGTAVVVLLAAVAGGTVFLDWRLGDELTTTSSRVTYQIDGSLREQSARLARVEERMQGMSDKTEVQALGERVAELKRVADAVVEKLDASQPRIDGLQKGIERAATSAETLQRELTQGVAALDLAVQKIGQDVAALRAAPRPAPASPESAPAGPVAEPKPDAAPGGLSKELMHHVTNLGDTDPGVRFQAVAALIDAKNPAVREHLLTTVKDPDPFVRRQTMEGLRTFKHASCVDALLTALADPESIVRHTAYASLKSLTGGTIAFDPNGSKEERAQAQKRWREWWEEHKKSFGT